MNSKYE